MMIEHRADSYQPKGGMCRGCKKSLDNCSDLDFESMPILSIELDEIIVRCTEFESNTAKAIK
jgi:hypothetical protein